MSTRFCHFVNQSIKQSIINQSVSFSASQLVNYWQRYSETELSNVIQIILTLKGLMDKMSYNVVTY